MGGMCWDGFTVFVFLFFCFFVFFLFFCVESVFFFLSAVSLGGVFVFLLSLESLFWRLSFCIVSASYLLKKNSTIDSS